MNSENNLIFRYDNTEHHRKLNLTTFPHHTPLLSLSVRAIARSLMRQ
ncbi:hypothetical protein COO91_08048 [Nostoc flagelliforme CCNUN1]|uniref:Uncharacterized protein n=2 Tax=Nostoc flagelliforme TaxID=1306274 RepID=A0A2K8T2M7_9NOSO|nr:hypothetical protein COO91_08048 [Nostoc flagelliforme CCNUN1]